MEKVQYYSVMALIMAIVAGVMLLLSILIWFKLNIKRDLAILTGSEARRDIERIRSEAAAGTVQADLRRKSNRGSVISWNTSERLNSGSLHPMFTGQNLSARMSASFSHPASARMSNALNRPDEDGTVLLANNQVQQPMQPAAGYDPNATVLLAPSGNSQPTGQNYGYGQPAMQMAAPDPDATTVLGTAAVPDPDATTVLGTPAFPENITVNSGFIIEKEERT